VKNQTVGKIRLLDCHYKCKWGGPLGNFKKGDGVEKGGTAENKGSGPNYLSGENTGCF